MELQECINFLLSTSQNKVFKYFSKLLEEYNVTPAQYGVLNCLWREGQLLPKQIGEMLYLEAPTVSGILDKMQKAGLIERSIAPDNRRTVLVVATPKANELKEKIEKATMELNQIAFQNLSSSEQAVLKKALYTIINTQF
ncbi:MarR family transcriptional regulator [Lysinibacillus macroides]|uniref:MarR family transcriptional regulator n=1 Tax=Lysinibacillus macroides TaxID=33935 RepID=A0A0N0CWP7_9BACI|nr:MarR family transcriptional regulator [Lysinibacillus macroides]KOY83455.1 MarR family transcriptional regulator [Lysinibacillus macroides]QPR69327.1 MarR family transcriptional regulator [Lysinibacillus macroides]